jgi:hypothetical protein
LPLLARCSALVEEAYGLYESGQDDPGRRRLEEMEKLLKTLPSQ